MVAAGKDFEAEARLSCRLLGSVFSICLGLRTVLKAMAVFLGQESVSDDPYRMTGLSFEPYLKERHERPISRSTGGW